MPYELLLIYQFRDEILYHAKLHPEQYSDTFSAAQLKQLHTSILYVTKTAVDLLADSSKFPDEWLFNHRWGKGKKDAPTKLPNGAAITFLTVGGRTSCVVPSVQKKTGAVAADVKNGERMTKGNKPLAKNAKGKKRKMESETEESEVETEIKLSPKKGRNKKQEAIGAIKDEPELEEESEGKPNSAKRTKSTANKKVKKEVVTERRRSGRGKGNL